MTMRILKDILKGECVRPALTSLGENPEKRGGKSGSRDIVKGREVYWCAKIPSFVLKWHQTLL